MIIDPTAEEVKLQPIGFAQHKHDQSVLTALSYYDNKSLVLPEISETNAETSFVWASRIRAKNYMQYVWLMFKIYLRQILGNMLFDRVKNMLW